MTIYSSQPVMMPYPGRHAKKAAKWTLATILIFLTFVGGILPVMPGIVDSLLPASKVGASLQKSNQSKISLSPGPGVPLPPGTVQSSSLSIPSASEVANGAVQPHLTVTIDSYVYQTSYGTYYFNRSAPFIFRLSSQSGAFLTKGSFFFLAGSGVFFPGASNVVTAIDNHFEVSYEVLSRQIVVAHLLLQVDFQASAKPKFTISLEKTSAWTPGAFNIVWATLPAQSWLRAGPIVPLDIGMIRGIQEIRVGSSRVDVGPSSDPSTWTEWLTTDWSDAPGARVSAGAIALGNMNGRGHVVIFPSNVEVIDPTQISTTTAAFGTGFSTQRKVVSYGGKYYAFFYSGSNIVWKSSIDHVTWSTTFVAGGGTGYGGTIGYSFDLYQSGASIALVWLSYNASQGGDGTTALYFRKGTLFSGDISWSSPLKVTGWTQPYSWPPSVAIGSDGTYWAAGIWYDASLHYNIWIYKSSDGSTWSLSTNYLTSSSGSRNDALQLIPLTQGRVMSLTSHYYDKTIRWTTWNPLTPTGAYWSAIQTFNVSLPANTPKWNLMSATTTPDGLVHMIYQKVTGPSSWNLAWAYYNATSGQWTASNNYLQTGGSPPQYPSLSSDRLGNLYAFWTNKVGSSTSGLFFESRSKGDFNWNPLTLTPFGSVSNSSWISAIRTPSKEILVVWMQGAVSPYSIFLGSMPLASGIASGPPTRPWSYLGLSPYEQYFAQNGEYISPGNGLLTVSQTDISAGGRNGLSLAVSRVYSQPFTLVQGSPYSYEVSPYAGLGNGWQLNLPWVATQYLQGPKYLHFINGELFPIIWNNITTAVSGDVIGTFTMTNHQSEDFVLTETMDLTTGVIQNYKLVTKEGTTYNFNGNGLLTTVVDRTGQNQLSFSYNASPPYYLSTITDTIGRLATFKYDANNHLANVTYAGQTVKYGYAGSNLASVTDAVGRRMTLTYSMQSNWLLSGIVYVQGGNSTYTYGSIPIGTDALNYYVTLQTVYVPGRVVKSSSFSYNITDGEASFTVVKQSDGQTIQGYTNYLFNAQASSMTRTVLNATSVQMLKQRFWYDPQGRSVQQDIYSGTSLTRSFFNSQFYDLWGNVIHTRDNIGHESYQSFANTNTQYAFQSSGSVTTTTEGRRSYDDFNGPNLNASAWVQGGSGTNKATNVSASQLWLRSSSSVGGTWQSNWVRSSGNFGYPFYAEVQTANWAGPGTDTISADLILSPQVTGSNANPFDNNDYLRFALRDGPSYKVLDRISGGSANTLWSDTATGVHAISWKVVLTDRNTLSVYLNRGGSGGYVLVYSTSTLGLSTSFAPAYVYLSFGNSNTSKYYGTFDFLGLSLSNSVTFNTLQAGQRVELFDWNDLLRASGSVANGQTSITLDATQMAFPYGYFKIYELDGRTVQFTSTTREVWGGSTYSYTKPFRSGGLTRSTVGFLQSSTLFVEDSVPTGATSYADSGDAWGWATNGLGPILSGTNSHEGFLVSGTHEHYFNGSSTTLFATSGYYLIQYVYIPFGISPSEIMLQFHTVSGNWEHRAYWGSNSITACGTTGSTCGTNGTPSRLPMGAIPSLQNGWMELIVKTDDVAVSGLNINGWAYTLYNGGVFWDYSAIGTSSMGTATFNNLLTGQKVEIYNSTNALKVSGTVPGGQTSVTLNMYTSGINAFPFRGYIKVYAVSGSLQYSSPLMIDIWGGDVYSYNQPVFSNSFSPGPEVATIHNSVIGTAQYQNATSTPEEDYSNYDSAGNLLQDLLRHSGSPLTTTYTYDLYGNKASTVNPTSEKSYYTYSATYQHAYLTTMTRVLTSTVNVTTTYSYNFTTGQRISIIDPIGNETDYTYDPITRLASITHPAVGGVRSDMAFLFQDSENSFGIENEKGNYTDFAYDGLSRITRIDFYKGALDSSPIISQRNYTYNWQNQLKTFQDPTGNTTTYTYDYLGRRVSVVNPGGTTRTVSYDDLNLVQSNYDENGHRVNNLYDPLQRLIGVREYYSVSSYYSTSYTYDGKSNLSKMTDAKSQTTTYTYDDLDRLVLTVFPDGFNETRTYDNISNLVTKKDPNGKSIAYGYDALNRLANVTYPDLTKVTYTYDKNGNRLSFSYLGNSATFTFDSRNRETGETWFIGGSQYVLSYAYDQVGNIASVTYPDGIKVTFSIDAMNRATTVKTGSTTLATLTYRPDNQLGNITYGDGVQTTYKYDNRGRTTEIKVVQGQTTLLDLNYGYDGAGNVISIGSDSYSYDFLNRLTTGTGPWGTIKYGYDGDGNRMWLYQSPTNTTYVYGSFDRLSSAGSTSYTYDNNGNRITQAVGGTTTHYNYDFENRLTSASQGASTLGNYTYSPWGQRIKKVESGTTTTYLNMGVNVLYEKVGTIVNDYVLSGGLIIAKLTAGTFYYFHQDLLGSTRLVTTGAGTNFSTNYEPFGVQYAGSGTDPVYKYTGKPQDSGTTLYYYAARYYDTTIGRFLTRDPLSANGCTSQSCGCSPGHSKGLGWPQNLNPYAYVMNNPELLTDPSGLDCTAACFFGVLFEHAVVTATLLLAAAALGCFFGTIVCGGLTFWWGGPLAALPSMTGCMVVCMEAAGWLLTIEIAFDLVYAGVLCCLFNQYHRAPSTTTSTTTSSSGGSYGGGGYGGGCVARNTPILTDHGYVPVQSLKPGDTVIGYDLKSGHLVTLKLVSNTATWENSLVSINDGVLRLTLTDQPIFVSNSTYTGWERNPQNVKVGDLIFNAVDHQWVPVHSVQVVKEQTLVYDVRTSGPNDFIANGYLLDWK